MDIRQTSRKEHKMDISYRGNIATVETHTYGPGKPYVARIKGQHPKYKLDREFCAKHDVTEARSNTYRDLEFFVHLDEEAVYQYRGLDATSGGGEDGFWKVMDGQLVDIDYAEVLQSVAA